MHQAQPHVTLIGVPTDVGASRLGAAMGPDALRVAQLGPALAQLGVQVHDIGNLAGPPNPRGARDAAGMRNLAECIAWNQVAHDAVWQALQQGRLPIMLGGDHTPPGQPQHGTDWQRLTKRVSGAGLYGAAGRA